MTPTLTAPAAEDVQRHAAWVEDLKGSLGEVIVGQEELVQGLLIGLLTGGHVLLEGVPGLAKTLAVSSLAQRRPRLASRASSSRPTCCRPTWSAPRSTTRAKATFAVRKGPIFANFVLADEINRAPAKVQSALLEAMQERQVSIGGQTFPLPKPFLVLATQNPIEQEGTYPLPEAQLDRFALKVVVGYPKREEELAILERMASTQPKTDARAGRRRSSRSCARAQRRRRDRRSTSACASTSSRSCIATREPKTRRPAGARRPHPVRRVAARDDLAGAVRARARVPRAAAATSRPATSRRVALDVLRHRVVPTYEAEAEGLTSDALVRARARDGAGSLSDGSADRAARGSRRAATAAGARARRLLAPELDGARAADPDPHAPARSTRRCRAATAARSAARASSSARCAPTSPATTCAASTGT